MNLLWCCDPLQYLTEFIGNVLLFLFRVMFFALKYCVDFVPISYIALWKFYEGLYNKEVFYRLINSTTNLFKWKQQIVSTNNRCTTTIHGKKENFLFGWLTLWNIKKELIWRGTEAEKILLSYPGKERSVLLNIGFEWNALLYFCKLVWAVHCKCVVGRSSFYSSLLLGCLINQPSLKIYQ